MEKVLIVFTDVHLAYSPSTLNLYDALGKAFDTEILAFEPDADYSSQRIEDKKIQYLVRPAENSSIGTPLVKRLVNEIKKSISPVTQGQSTLLTHKARILIEKIKEFDGQIIAVDFFALWCVQHSGKKAHLFSLEIIENDLYRNDCDLSSIQSVIIQTPERYNYLFPKGNHKVFYIQNAPNYLETSLNIEARNPRSLVFCGSAIPWFGFISCLEFIIDFPQYTLTVKGAVPSFVKKVIDESYSSLINEKRLILDETYLNAEELNAYLTNFYVGFVFYDMARFEYINKFNYKTAPSGKLFQLYNAGVPVVASNLPGLSSAKEYNAGVLINSLGSGEIAKAIGQISAEYEYFAKGAKNASAVFDFGKGSDKFVQFLLN